MNVFRFVLFKQCNVYFCVSRGKNWIFLQALQIIRTKLCQRQRPMILNYFLKEYYLHSPYQTLREASYYLNLHFFPLFNYSYDVGRSMMIKGMQFEHVQCNILIYTTSLKFDVRIFTLILMWSTKNKMLSFKWKLDVLYRSNLLQFTSIYNFSFSHGNNSLGLMNGALLNRRGPPFLINLKIRHPSRKHVNTISEMCNSGWKYTYSKFKINQA